MQKIKTQIKNKNQGDILTFKEGDDRFKALLCTSTNKEKSPQCFTFAALTIDEQEKPTRQRILHTNFFGVGNTRNGYLKYSDGELARMWYIHPDTIKRTIDKLSRSILLYEKNTATQRKSFIIAVTW